jgi:hypothetical protein
VPAGNRLTSEQLAALAAGDTVTIETGSDFGRSRHTPGTVVRTGPSHVVVRVEAPGAAPSSSATASETDFATAAAQPSWSLRMPTIPRPGTYYGAARSASTPRIASGAAAVPTWKRDANCRTPSATTWQRR